MKIAIGCDHGGFGVKPTILDYLKKSNIEYVDYGCDSSKSVDYIDYALPVCEAVVKGECDLGILICGTGIGMSITANKIKGIRCGHCTDTFSARMTRLHNNANVIALGERITGAGLMVDIVDAFINTPFSNEERHANRVEKIKQVENKNFK
jgi:RpiB/LacA/LacB family sugar-phosphate isomerase